MSCRAEASLFFSFLTVTTPGPQLVWIPLHWFKKIQLNVVNTFDLTGA